MFTRGGNQPNVRHQHIVKALAQSHFPDCVLDGELIAFDERGLPKFQLLQQSRRNDAPIALVAFDLLNLSGRNVKLLSLEERKHLLADLRHLLPAEITISDVLDDEIARLTAALDRIGLEGLIAKRRDSIYRPGSRASEWVKFKFYEVGEFVIGGYMPGPQRVARSYTDAQYFDALILGEYVDGKLIYKEKLRFGYQPGDKQKIFERIENLRIPNCPFSNLPQPMRRGALDLRQMPECIWVEPRVWCEAAYRERTHSGELREHAKFRRLLSSPPVSVDS
jgi:bifunctional non-homologous end joining protein LigD